MYSAYVCVWITFHAVEAVSQPSGGQQSCHVGPTRSKCHSDG